MESQALPPVTANVARIQEQLQELYTQLMQESHEGEPTTD